MLLRLWNLGKSLFRRAPPGPAAPAPDAGEAPGGALPAGRLDCDAQQWLQALPEYARPKQLSARHPGVVNRIASVWADRNMCADLIECLLADERAGFSAAIRAELVRLQFLHRKLMTVQRPLPVRQPKPATESHPADA